MVSSVEPRLHDPADAARWQGLAVLLGSLRTADDRARFATLYRREARDAEAEDALSGLLEAAAALWAREASPCTCRTSEVAQVA
jgi:hypothetical protein